jgi:hypothetical protein
MKRKLRIFISHQYPIRIDPDNSGADDEQIQYWEMRVEGRLLDDVSSDLYIVTVLSFVFLIMLYLA